MEKIQSPVCSPFPTPLSTLSYELQPHLFLSSAIALNSEKALTSGKRKICTAGKGYIFFRCTDQENWDILIHLAV